MSRVHHRAGRLGVVASLVMVASGLVGSAPASAAAPHPAVRIALEGADDPRGMAVDGSGNLYVADTFHDRVVKLPHGGGPQQVVGFTGLFRPNDVAVDGPGNVFVADSGNDRVLKLPVGGGAQQTVGFTGLFNPLGVAVDGAGTVYVRTLVTLSKLPAGGGPQVDLPIAVSPTGDVEVDGAGNVYLTDDNDHVLRYPGGAGPAVTLAFTGLSTARGLAVDSSGSVYVADADNQRVVRLPAGGGPQEVVATALDSVWDVAVDPAGTVYTSLRLVDRVLAVPVPGAQIALGFEGLSTPYAVAVHTSGEVFVADAGLNEVRRLPVGGGPQQTLGFSGLSLPYGVAVDDAGNVYVSDSGNNRVLLLPVGGGAQQTLGFTGLDFPLGLAVDPAGNVYVADSGNNRVVVLPAGGDPQQTVGFTGLSNPYAVAIDGAGNVFVADNGNDRLLKRPAGGGAQVQVQVPGLSSPTGLAADHEGNLTVVDGTDGQIIRVPVGWGPARPVGFTGLGNPFALAVDTNGNTFVTDSANHRVIELVGPPAPDTGYLRVTTSPAVPSQITVDGEITDTWGLTWVKEQPGQHQVCFRAQPRRDTPPCQTVTVTAGTTTTVTGTFASRGFLRVTTSPAVASAIAVDGVPRNNWGLWTDFPAGSHTVCFGAVAGFTPPSCQTVDVTAGATTEITGTYTATPAAPAATGVGFLRVTTSPAVPSQITVDGNVADAWGLNWLEVPPGTHHVCFGALEGYSTPACQDVSVTVGNTTTVTGSFAPRGYLRVLTSPAVAGTIAIAGKPVNDWGNYTDRPPGTYQICFGAVEGYRTPACQTATVTAGNTATITGTYG